MSRSVLEQLATLGLPANKEELKVISLLLPKRGEFTVTAGKRSDNVYGGSYEAAPIFHYRYEYIYNATKYWMIIEFRFFHESWSPRYSQNAGISLELKEYGKVGHQQSFQKKPYECREHIVTQFGDTNLESEVVAQLYKWEGMCARSSNARTSRSK